MQFIGPLEATGDGIVSGVVGGGGGYVWDTLS